MDKNYQLKKTALAGEIEDSSKTSAVQVDLPKKLSICSTPESRQCLPYSLAERLQVLPLVIIDSDQKEVLVVAAAKTDDQELINTLRFAVDKEVKIVKAEASALPEAIFIAYHQDQTLLQKQIDCLTSENNPDQSNENQLAITPFDQTPGSIAMLFASIIKYAVAQRASDLHLIPVLNGTQVKLRINGEIYQQSRIVGNKNSHEHLINRIKVLARLSTIQKRTPQDGSLKIDLGGRPVNIRVSIMPTVHGQKAVLRFLGSQRLLSLENLGLDQQTRFFIEKYLQKAQGAVLFAGITGSGKTTTMYAMLEKLLARNLNIVTIEDPVEIYLEGISQTSLDTTANLDFASCLRSVLRQDPDVILLGEIRDQASATTALQAALTGHALLSTVHARSSLEVFLRLQNLQVDILTIAQAVQLIVCQKLLPRLCDNCKQLDKNASSLLNVNLFRPQGCGNCDQSGFSGRVLATEALWVDGQLAEKLAVADFQFTKLKSVLSSACYHPMKLSLEILMKSGQIGIQQYYDCLD